MSSDRQSRIHELFAAAIDEDPGERESLLRRECGGDEALFDEVRSLLSHHEAAEGFIDTPVIQKALDDSATADLPIARDADSTPPMPDRIGAYRVIRRLGEGGMGVVYLAEQQSPKRTVALKVIRSGVMSPRTLRRFEHEAQVLGRLQHPGIAQIFEAGTARVAGQTQPFFALEYIEGLSLSDYASKERLGVRARMQLLARICDAVHHAHQKGVIHRDLKPSNILVDGAGQPKILDFGVARVTDSDVHVTTLQTDVGQLVGTIPYMSPEQITGSGDELDTRSDVYALGVVCYQLLTGQLPYDLARKVITEAARIIREDEPTPISTINRSLRGDIQTIVFKTLEKDRERRYQSASELAADIRRYLKDEPIVARPASTIYQIRKFARRNKAIVGATIAVIIALAGGLIYSNIQRERAVGAEQFARVEADRARREARKAADAEQLARSEAERAQREARKAAGVTDFLIRTIASASPVDAGDRDLTVVELMLEAAERVEIELADEPVVLAGVQTTIGRALSSLARYDEAEIQLQRALASQTALLGEDHVESIATTQVLGTLRKLQGRYPEAETYMARALELSERVNGPRSKHTAQIANDMGTIRLRLGRYDAALVEHQRALDIMVELEGEDSAMTGEILGNIGFALSALQRFDEAEKALTRALEITKATGGDRSIIVASLLNNLGFIRRNAGDLAGAVEATREAHQIDEEVYGKEHPRTIRSLSNLAVMLRRTGESEEAERLYREVVVRNTKVLGPDHPSVANSLTNLGFLLSITNREEEACEKLAEALRILRDALPAGHVKIANTLSKYGDALMGLDRYTDAEAMFREAGEILVNSRGSESWPVGSTSCKLGRSLIAQDRGDEGEPLIRRGVEILLREGYVKGEVERGVFVLAAFYESKGEQEKASEIRRLLDRAMAEATTASDED